MKQINSDKAKCDHFNDYSSEEIIERVKCPQNDLDCHLPENLISTFCVISIFMITVKGISYQVRIKNKKRKELKFDTQRFMEKQQIFQ